MLYYEVTGVVDYRCCWTVVCDDDDVVVPATTSSVARRASMSSSGNIHLMSSQRSGGVPAWLSVWSELQTCICPSWCHCHSLSLATVKSRLVLPFWYRFTQVVPEKGPLNGCVFVWVVSGLTECLLCRIIVTLCVEFCNWCDNFALKISVVTDSQENFLCNSDRNFHLSLTKLFDYFVKFEIRNINFMQQTTSSFLPQTPISCFLANVCNVQGAYLKCSASAADCSAGFSL